MHARTHRRWWGVSLVAGLSLALTGTACGGGGEEPAVDVGQDAVDEEMQDDTLAEDASEGAAEEPLDAETAGATEAADEQGAQGFTTELQPLNGSNAMGTATVQVDGNQVTVTVNTEGVSPALPHAQHIHIGGQNTCPSETADSDGDGLISTPEGKSAYGGIEVSLTTEGDVGEKSALAVERFPVASDDGTITYQRTFDLPQGTTVEELSKGVIVQHGIADTKLGSDPSKYDGPDSPLKAGLPQEATLPTLCGALGNSQ